MGLIAIGSIVVLLDFTFSISTNGSGFRFDVINDVIGMLLILVGLVRLASFRIDSQYDSTFRFLKTVALICCFEAGFNHFIFATPEPWILSFAILILGLAKLVAVIYFCRSMIRLSQHYLLPQSAASWTETMKWVGLFWVVPMLIILSLSGYTLMINPRAEFNLGVFFLPAIALMLLPVIRLFSAISVMRREAILGEPSSKML